MEPSARVKAAFQAMENIGISKHKTKPALKKLLKLFDKNWDLIEEENYRVLLYTIFEYEDTEAAEKEKSMPADIDLGDVLVEEAPTQDETDRPLKRLRKKYQDQDVPSNGQPSPSPSSSAFVLKIPKPEPGEPEVPNVGNIRTESQCPVRDKGKQPVSPTPNVASRNNRASSQRASQVLQIKEPNPTGVGHTAKQKQSSIIALIQPKDEPFTDDIVSLECRAVTLPGNMPRNVLSKGLKKAKLMFTSQPTEEEGVPARGKNTTASARNRKMQQNETATSSRSTTGEKSPMVVERMRQQHESEQRNRQSEAVVDDDDDNEEDEDEDGGYRVEPNVQGSRVVDDDDDDDDDDSDEEEEEEEEMDEEVSKKGKMVVGESSGSNTSRRRGLGLNTVTEPNCPGGPIDPTLIPSYSGHILYAVSEDQSKDRKVLGHYSQTGRMRKSLEEWDLEGKLGEIVVGSGLSHILGCMYEDYDMPLISAFVERWQPDTNTFHMPWGEMTILLHDVQQILALPIDGEQIKDFYCKTGDIEFAVRDLLELGESYDLRAKSYKPLKPSGSSKQKIGPILSGRDIIVEPLTDVRHKKKVSDVKARAYLLALIGQSLFMGTCRDKIPADLLFVLRSTKHRIQDYAWGVGTLACLYRNLGKASRAGGKGISGCLTLLQAWIYMYFPHFRPAGSSTSLPDSSYPCSLLFRGRTKMQINDGRYRKLRSELDTLSSAQVSWCPYGDRLQGGFPPMSLYFGVINCMDMTESYHPARCLRQFGYVQTIPASPIYPLTAIRPPNIQAYKLTHAPAQWDTRAWSRVPIAEISMPLVGGMPDVDPTYMTWYHTYSHPLFHYVGSGGDVPQFDMQSYMQMSGVLHANFRQAYDLRGQDPEQWNYEAVGRRIVDHPDDFDTMVRRMEEMRLNAYRPF